MQSFEQSDTHFHPHLTFSLLCTLAVSILTQTKIPSNYRINQDLLYNDMPIVDNKL